MTLSTGARVGSYEVTGSLGAGGMGEVYRARDTKLNREVALKVLPDAFADDPDRLARFQREAEVLASLNHPNIAGIHGLEESGGIKALVLELVEGPTLDERLPEAGLPLDEAVEIARQIAEALEAAHDAGVIHRDLKPANIKVRDDGTVKVLDFGLAKALQPEASDARLSLSPTISLTAAATQIGMVMGTAAYMAPEQAKGKPVDKRADIWAFGAVLYELLTGRKTFAGEDVSETMAHVLTRPVDWDALPSATPASLARLLKRCLERDPKARLRDIGEARIALSGSGEVANEPDAESQPGPDRSTATRTIAIATAAAAVAALVAMVATGTRMSPLDTADGGTKHFVIPLASHALPASGPGPFVAVSADGRSVVYVGVRDGQVQLFRRQLDELQAFAIEGSENARRPFLSPDGQSVGFITGGNFDGIKQVALSGGTPRTVIELPDQIMGGDWGPDNQIVYGFGTALFAVSADGGEPQQVTSAPVEDGVLGYRWPHLVAGTDVLLYTRWRGSIATSDVVALSLETGEEQRLVGGSGAQYTPSGHILFGRGTELWAGPFDPAQLEMSGPPVRLVENLLSFTRGGAANFAVTSDGALFYVPTSLGIAGSDLLVRVDRDGGNPTPVTSDALQNPRHLQLSPDGRSLVLVTGPTELGEIWIYPIDGRPPTPLRQEGQTRWDLHRLDADGEVSVVAQNRGEDTGAQISPNGRFVAYETSFNQRRELWVRGYPDGVPTRISGSGGEEPRWSHDGTELFFVEDATLNRGRLMVTAVDTDGEFRFETPELLFEESFDFGEDFPYVVLPDGDFIVQSGNQGRVDLEVDGGSLLGDHLVAVVGLGDELRRIAPPE